GPPQALEVPANRRVFRACCSRDGRRLAISDHARGRAIIVNVARPSERTVIGNCPSIHSLALSPDGRFLAIAQVTKTSSLGVWETSHGRLVRRLPGSQHYAG